MLQSKTVLQHTHGVTYLPGPQKYVKQWPKTINNSLNGQLSNIFYFGAPGKSMVGSDCRSGNLVSSYSHLVAARSAWPEAIVYHAADSSLKALRTHIYRLLGPRNILYRVLGNFEP